MDASNPVLRAFGGVPEIAFLDRWHVLPPLALTATMYVVGKWAWLIWGFCLPTIAQRHGQRG